MDDSVVGELKSGYRRVSKPNSSTLPDNVLVALRRARVGVSRLKVGKEVLVPTPT